MVRWTGVIGKNRMDTKILIASARSGSNWFEYSYIPDRVNDLGEFLNKDWKYWTERRNNSFNKDIIKKLDNDTLSSKIKFLETERQQGREYFYKLFPSQIYDSKKDYREWLYNFYKNDKVYYLQRNNKWLQFLSYVYQNKTNWENPVPLDNETIVSTKVTCTKEDVNNWIDMNSRDMSLDMTRFKNVEYHFYEDLDLPSKTVKVSNHINYEEQIENAKEFKWMIL